jgi:nitrogen fixation/metabolism regulation signal transduction histidine kinase
VRNQRRKIWIDSFQTRLSFKLAAYFILYQVAVWALFWIDSRFADLGRSQGIAVFTYGYFLTPIAAISLGLIFIFDALRETHRIVGPLYRFRKTIESITAGEDVRLIKLRTGDHLLELRDRVNDMLRELEKRGAVTLVSPTASEIREPASV